MCASIGRGPLQSVSDFAALLRRASSAKDLLQGRKIHEILVENGAAQDRGTFLGNLLVQMYGTCGSCEEAVSAFSRICRRNVFSWNILITAFAQSGHLHNAQFVFQMMPQHDGVSWNTLISAYAQAGNVNGALQTLLVIESQQKIQPSRLTFISVLDAFSDSTPKFLEHGEHLHRKILQNGFQADLQTQTALIRMYDRCGGVQQAVHLFDRMANPDQIAFNAMLSAYARNGHLHEALNFLQQMPARNLVSWSTLMLANLHSGAARQVVQIFQAMDLEDLRMGVILHEEIAAAGLESDVFVGTSVMIMYQKCSQVESARISFEKIENRNQVAWNAMVTTYAQNGHFEEASLVFELMPYRDAVSWTVMLLEHAQNGYLDEARILFDRIVFLDTTSWNVMIAAYAERGQSSQALKLLAEMDLEGFEADRVTFINILAGQLTKSEAIMLEDLISGSGFFTDFAVVTALLRMHGRSGRLLRAWEVFLDSIKRQSWNVILWSAMLAAYAQNGHAKEALELFHVMNLEAVEANDVTFVSILSACSHAGLLADGMKHFHSVKTDFGISYTKDHYVCMADLLGRSGELEEAEQVVSSMPFAPDCGSWMTLLAACRVQGKVGNAERFANRAFELQPGNPSPYIMLCNIYNEAGRIDDALRIRKLMTERNLRKRASLLERRRSGGHTRRQELQVWKVQQLIEKVT